MTIKRVTVVLAVLGAFVLGLFLGSGRDSRDGTANDMGDVPPSSHASDTRESDPLKRERIRPTRVAPAGSAHDAAADRPPSGELALGRATLLSRSKHNDYETATFSFEHGIRDDVDLRVSRNDWELQYGNGGDWFDVRMITDDQSTIRDLGVFVSWSSLPTTTQDLGEDGQRAPVQPGHVYLVHTLDSDSDHTSVFRVAEFVAGDRVTIEWADWLPARRGSGESSTIAAGAKDDLTRYLHESRVQRDAATRATAGELSNPVDILLQLRTGAQGGNRSTVSLVDSSGWSRVTVGEAPLDVTTPCKSRGDPTAFVRGGFIPRDRALVVTSVDVYANAQGDSNGDGFASVQVGRRRLIALGDGEGPAADWFAGAVVLRPGDERRMRIEAKNSSSVAARVRGRLIALSEADAVDEAPLWPAVSPPSVERVVPDVTGTRGFALTEPRALLQVRAGHAGGNPIRVSLLGKASIYVDSISNERLQEPLDFEATSDSVGYIEGGRIPHGKAFLVTRVDYRLRKTKKSHGAAFISVMGERLAAIDQRDDAGEDGGSWIGAIVVPAGSEKRVFAEASYFSWIEATLHGEFIDAPRGER